MAETRTDISEETQKALSLGNFLGQEPLGLENVRGLERPMTSGPKDTFIGYASKICRRWLG